jgi:hypothetical protein
MSTAFKPPVKLAYNIGRATAEKKSKNTDDPNNVPDGQEAEKHFNHTLTSTIVETNIGRLYIISKLCVVKAYSRKVEGNPDAENPRERVTHHRFVPEEDIFKLLITDGENAWKGSISYAENNVSRVRANGRDDTWKKDYFIELGLFLFLFYFMKSFI